MSVHGCVPACAVDGVHEILYHLEDNGRFLGSNDAIADELAMRAGRLLAQSALVRTLPRWSRDERSDDYDR